MTTFRKLPNTSPKDTPTPIQNQSGRSKTVTPRQPTPTWLGCRIAARIAEANVPSRWPRRATRDFFTGRTGGREVREVLRENAFLFLEDQNQKYFLGESRRPMRRRVFPLARWLRESPKNLASRTSRPPVLPVNLRDSNQATGKEQPRRDAGEMRCDELS